MQQIECSFIIYCSLPFGTGTSLVPLVKSPPATTGDAGSIPGSGRSPGEGNGNPLQYSCLENSIDKGDWWATGHRVTKELDTTEHAHTHTHTHPFKTKLAHSHCGSSQSWEFSRLLIKHQEARFQTPWCSEIFQSCLRDKSYPEMCF